MEVFILNFLKNNGLNAIGFAMLFFYMKNNFKERADITTERNNTIKQIFDENDKNRKENTDNINKLVDRIDKMIDLLHTNIVHDTQINVTTKEQLEKISENQEWFKEKISHIEEKIIATDLRTKLCPNTKKREE